VEIKNIIIIFIWIVTFKIYKQCKNTNSHKGLNLIDRMFNLSVNKISWHWSRNNKINYRYGRINKNWKRNMLIKRWNIVEELTKHYKI
jgi:hypothetical protein